MATKIPKRCETMEDAEAVVDMVLQDMDLDLPKFRRASPKGKLVGSHILIHEDLTVTIALTSIHKISLYLSTISYESVEQAIKFLIVTYETENQKQYRGYERN